MTAEDSADRIYCIVRAAAIADAIAQLAESDWYNCYGSLTQAESDYLCDQIRGMDGAVLLSRRAEALNAILRDAVVELDELDHDAILSLAMQNLSASELRAGADVLDAQGVVS